MAKKKTYKVVGPVSREYKPGDVQTIWGLFDRAGTGYIVSHVTCLPIPDEVLAELGPGAYNGPECMAFPAKQHVAGLADMDDITEMDERAVNREEDAEKAFELIVQDLGIEVEHDA